jgi:hypothetical protein
MTNTKSADAQQASKKWARSDKLSLVAVIAASVACLVSAIKPAQSVMHYLARPRVTIGYPLPGSDMPNNTFGAWGKASNIPASSELWLVVRSGVEGRYYPVDNLAIVNGTWSIRSNRICPGAGLQDIQVYLVPGTGGNALFDYIRGSAANQGTGINSVPPQAVLEATSNVEVAGSSEKSC